MMSSSAGACDHQARTSLVVIVLLCEWLPWNPWEGFGSTHRHGAGAELNGASILAARPVLLPVDPRQGGGRQDFPVNQGRILIVPWACGSVN